MLSRARELLPAASCISCVRRRPIADKQKTATRPVHHFSTPPWIETLGLNYSCSTILHTKAQFDRAKICRSFFRTCCRNDLNTGTPLRPSRHTIFTTQRRSLQSVATITFRGHQQNGGPYTKVPPEHRRRWMLGQWWRSSRNRWSQLSHVIYHDGKQQLLHTAFTPPRFYLFALVDKVRHREQRWGRWRLAGVTTWRWWDRYNRCNCICEECGYTDTDECTILGTAWRYDQTLGRPEIEEGSCRWLERRPGITWSGNRRVENQEARRQKLPRGTKADQCGLPRTYYYQVTSRYEPDGASSICCKRQPQRIWPW